MPNEISIPDELKHLIEKREQTERRQEQRRDKTDGPSADERREDNDRRHDTRREEASSGNECDQTLRVKDSGDEPSSDK